MHMCSVSFAPKMGNIWPPDPLFKQDLAYLCSCHDYYLKVNRRQNLSIYPVFVTPFPRANISNLEPTYLLSQEILTG